VNDWPKWKECLAFVVLLIALALAALIFYTVVSEMGSDYNACLKRGGDVEQCQESRP
jgi:hypothetical protein